MLEPQDRSLLLESLKPPLGYALDFAIGTTYSLDLITLLSIPLSFALLDRTDRFGNTVADPLTLLGGIRRTADKFVVFCQAGAIEVPPPNRTLLGLLEANVVQAAAPNGGVFHPKCWLLRFTAPQPPVLYRLICATRNLTGDRCWDTALILEGELIERKLGFSGNRPLADFFAALPSLATSGMDAKLRQRVEELAVEARRVEFDRPEDFDEIAFHPIGLARGKAHPFEGRLDRLLIVSPFVSADTLRDLSNETDELHVVTRLESVDELPPALIEELSSIKVFAAEVDRVDEPVEEGGRSEAAEPESQLDSPKKQEECLTGLHAKLYIADAGTKARVWTGSANATTNAFLRNVEFLVELTGRKRKCGIEAFLATEPGETRFADFLVPVSSVNTSPSDERERHLDQLLDVVRRKIAACKLRVLVEAETASFWRLSLTADEPSAILDLPVASLTAWPVTCHPEGRRQPVLVAPESSHRLSTFAGLPTEFLTTFIGFQAEASEGDLRRCIRFTINAQSEGMPTDRAERLLLKIVANPIAFESYVRMMLADVRQPSELLGLATGLDSSRLGVDENEWRPSSSEPALFEMIVRVLARDPERIDDIMELMTEIARAGRTDNVLPAGFAQLWESVRAVREEGRGGTQA